LTSPRSLALLAEVTDLGVRDGTPHEEEKKLEE
jgi:hypothetical protein